MAAEADLSIYRGMLQPPPEQQVMTPYQYAAGANAIAEQRQQQDLNRQRMAQNAVTLRSTTQEADEYARKTAEHNQIVDVLRKHDGDFEKATPEIMHINPIVGQQFAEQNRARKAAQAEAAKQMFSTLAGYAGDLITAHPYDKDNDPQDTRLGAAYQVRAAQLEAAGAIPKGVLPPKLTKPREQLQGFLQEHQLTQQQTAADKKAELDLKKAKDAREEEEARNKAQAAARLEESYNRDTGLSAKEEATLSVQEQQAAAAARNAAANERRADAYEKHLTLGGVGGGQTGNSRAVDRRLADKSLATIEKDEAKFNRLRTQLGNAISRGTIYIDKNGNVKPMATASNGDPGTEAALMDEMKDRFADTTDDLKKHIARKNEILQSQGKKVGQSTTDAWETLDKGSDALNTLIAPGTDTTTTPAVRPGTIGAIGTPAAPAATAPAPVAPAPVVAPRGASRGSAPALPPMAAPAVPRGGSRGSAPAAVTAPVRLRTEAEIREGARRRGLDEDLAVQVARQRGAIQ